MKPLAQLEPGKCAAIIESDRYEDGAKHYSMQRIVSYGRRRCSYSAKEQVGHLHLCARHARLAREGFVAEDGNVSDRGTIRDMRAYPDKFPGGQYRWVRKGSP
jgi:hypothetical protein